MGYGAGDYPLWKYLIMPFMSGLVGYITNVLALEMTFRPIEYKGVNWWRMKEQPWGLFGWQGIIPTKVKKMATICVDLMTKELFDLKEIFGRLEPEKFYTSMEDGILVMIDEILNDVAEVYMTKTWSYMPESVKKEAVITAHRACPEFLTAFVLDMQNNIEEILDIQEMCVSACVKNKEIVNQIFQECGEKEFIFIRRSGFYFGFLFGCIQMGLWFAYSGAWLLPVCGFVVGWFTNFFALKVIFRPLKPKKIGPVIVQGLFLKRQKEVSETFARVICVELLDTEKMWEAILSGPRRKNFQLLLRAHSIVFTEKLIGGLRPLALAAMGSEQFAMMKEDIATKVIEKLPGIIGSSYDYTTEALDLEATIREEMQALSAERFEGVLHPAFEEDEMTLIMVGGFLGLIVGFIQMGGLF
mmetsp:Transcript_24038/g.36656  ORF Transcript_24038/g.36656 Transcript_24038/m.36656 type:complete len:414 (-) Transcript_24038:113-1354(-)|eukprot:CAMPEP_0194086756 /NCGR_PEP_ID=MMETSP0149-20130528/22344_1 /TAXON_ID=122233 /ORGANISM="Chaetoceros debilis, Strain MM31A-1" /LENGTH=413 /DNA_ID=CAMNT_0038769925 /DNA_START=243 /DNA_END=1484 /DNA_ORIENTATION=+